MGHTIKSYERAFRVAREKCSNDFILSGDTCIVGVIPQDDLTPPGKIILSSGASRQVNGLEAKRPVLVRVLEVGPGHYDEDGKTVPADAEVGDVLLVGINSVTEISQYGKLQNHGRVQLGLCNASQALIRWRGEQGFNVYFETLLAEVDRES